jgi:hypothetical protein
MGLKRGSSSEYKVVVEVFEISAEEKICVCERKRKKRMDRNA